MPIEYLRCRVCDEKVWLPRLDRAAAEPRCRTHGRGMQTVGDVERAEAARAKHEQKVRAEQAIAAKRAAERKAQADRAASERLEQLYKAEHRSTADDRRLTPPAERKKTPPNARRAAAIAERDGLSPYAGRHRRARKRAA